MAIKTQHVHIDSRSRNMGRYADNSKYIIRLPTTYHGVKKVDLLNMQVPNSNFNVSETNNTFWLYESAEGGGDHSSVNDQLLRRVNFSPTRLFLCTVPPGMHTITTFVDAVRYSIEHAACSDGSERQPTWQYTVNHDTTLNRVLVDVTDQAGIAKSDVWSAIVIGSLQPVWYVELRNRCPSECDDDHSGLTRRFTVAFGTARTQTIQMSLCPDDMTPENGAHIAADIQQALRTASRECHGVCVEFVPEKSSTKRITVIVYTPPRNATIGMPAPDLRGTCVLPLRVGECTTALAAPGYQLPGMSVLARPFGAETVVNVASSRLYFSGIPDLTTERYILLRCPELGEIVQIHDANRANITDASTRRAFTDVYAVIPLPSVAGSLVFQDGATGKGDDALGSRYFPGPGLSVLHTLTFEFVHFDGTRVNFRGLEHSMMFRISYTHNT